MKKVVEGLQIIVNGVDVRTFKDVYGLHGQLAFFTKRRPISCPLARRWMW